MNARPPLLTLDPCLLRRRPGRSASPPLPSRPSHRGLRALAIVGLVAMAPASATAESGVTLLVPTALDEIGATTFDERGEAVGRSRFELSSMPTGEQTLRVDMRIEGGGSNYSEAKLAPVEAAIASATGATMGPATGPSRVVPHRVVEERSQARSADGTVFPLLVIDHTKRRVSCYPDGEPESAGRHQTIPEGDRVVNVPMQLLFQPLVRGEVDTVRFQLATCKDGPVLYDMIAVLGPEKERDGRRIVEVEYGPDFGETVAFFASRLLPSFSFWFDAEDGGYLGHRMPLHRKGPEVTLVRQGLTPEQIGAD